jgi:hypothetical protein
MMKFMLAVSTAAMTLTLCRALELASTQIIDNLRRRRRIGIRTVHLLGLPLSKDFEAQSGLRVEVYSKS